MSAQPCSRNQGSKEDVCSIHQADNRCLTTSGRRRCSYTFSVIMCCLMGPPERSSMCKPYQIAPSLSCSPCFSAADQNRSAAQQMDVVMGNRWLKSGSKTMCRQYDCHAGSLDVSSIKVHAVTAEAKTSRTNIVQVLHTAVPMIWLHKQGQNLALCIA